MTKFILHGGDTSEANPDNNNFFAEMTRGTKGKTLVLLNYFSRKDSDVERCAKQDKKRIIQLSKNKNLDFEIANSQTITQQLKRAQIMYMRGGDTSKLLKVMSKIPNLHKLLKNKIIAGSSAGVYALAKYYWSNSKRAIGKGLGVLNFKVYCHYKPEDTKIIKKLLAYKENLPILTLPNYKWVVIFV